MCSMCLSIYSRPPSLPSKKGVGQHVRAGLASNAYPARSSFLSGKEAEYPFGIFPYHIWPFFNWQVHMRNVRVYTFHLRTCFSLLVTDSWTNKHPSQTIPVNRSGVNHFSGHNDYKTSVQSNATTKRDQLLLQLHVHFHTDHIQRSKQTHGEQVIWANLCFISIYACNISTLMNKLQVPLYGLIHIYDGCQTIIHTWMFNLL